MTEITLNGYTLRIFKESDASDFYQLVSDNRERLRDFFAGTVAQTLTEQDTLQFIKNALERHSRQEYYPFTLFSREQKAIGFIDIKNIDHRIPKAEIGFFIDQSYASKGLVSGFLSALLDHFFSELNYEKMFLRTHKGNTPARKVATKLGFKEEGVIRSDYKTTAGHLVDLIYYGKLKHEHQDH